MKIMLRCAPFVLFADLIVLAALPGRADEKQIDSKKEPQAEPAKKDEIPVDPDALANTQVQLPPGINYEVIQLGDGKPLAGPSESPDEWAAYTKILSHASRVPISALKLRARHSIEYSSLTDKDRFDFYQKLIYIKGRMIALNKVETGEVLRSANLKELYDAWIVQDDFRSPIKVMLTELPEGYTFDANVGEPVEIDAYYFKYANFSGERVGDRPAPKYAPLMIGRSFRLINPAPRPINTGLSEAEQLALPGPDPDAPDFSKVKDRVPLASYSENQEEYLAYTYAFRKVMQFGPEVLARNSRRDVVYADLINEIRDPEYLRKLLHIEGRLVRIRQRDARDFLKMPEVPYVYEGWILHDEVKEHPIVVAFTELPEGMEVGERISHDVAVDGYYFKLMAYRSQEKDDKGKDVWRVAPLLVARKPIVKPDPRDRYSWDGFMPLVLGLGGIVAVAALILTVWFRRGDRQTRERVRDTMLAVNPFDELSPPAVQPGTAWDGLNESTPQS